MKLARILTGNQHDAWDLTQDTLVQMFKKWGHIDRIAGNPVGYARKTLVNLNCNRLRRIRREFLVSKFHEDSYLDALNVPEFDSWLDTAIASLPSRQRAAVALAYLEDMPVSQIAEVLGCSLSAAKSTCPVAG